MGEYSILNVFLLPAFASNSGIKYIEEMYADIENKIFDVKLISLTHIYRKILSLVPSLLLMLECLPQNPDKTYNVYTLN